MLYKKSSILLEFLLSLFLSPRMPFNWKTPFGYLIALLSETAAMLSAHFMILPIVCFVVGSYCLSISIFKDITKSDFHILSDKISNGNHIEMNELMYNFMQKFSQVKQLSWFILSFHRPINAKFSFILRIIIAFNNIFNVLIVNLFIWSLLIISKCLFSLQSQLLVK